MDDDFQRLVHQAEQQAFAGWDWEFLAGRFQERSTSWSYRDIVIEQMKTCLEAAGSSLRHVVKCQIYCTSAEHFGAVNKVYNRFFPADPPARIFIPVPPFPGPFDVEIDCVATLAPA